MCKKKNTSKTATTTTANNETQKKKTLGTQYLSSYEIRKLRQRGRMKTLQHC